jgi:hypothetical protein
MKKIKIYKLNQNQSKEIEKINSETGNFAMLLSLDENNQYIECSIKNLEGFEKHIQYIEEQNILEDEIEIEIEN